MNFDILKAIGKGYSKDFGKQRLEEKTLQLESQYPSLCRQADSKLNSSTSKRKAKHKELIRGIGFEPMESSSTKINQPNRKPIDLSSSKLARLDDPGSFTPVPRIGKRKIKAIKKKLKDRTKGPQWFDMTAPEITDDRKNDLEALKLRGALDTKRFYKRNNAHIKPKHFHVGKVVEGAADYYNSRVPKKQRKRTIAEELMSEIRN